MKPFHTNFCSGNFKDWMEVFLTSKCQGRCAWCVENGGFRPSEELSWRELANVIIDSGKKNVVLLGGEPTLYHDIKLLINRVVCSGIHVFLTTNGGKLTPDFVKENLSNLAGMNISIHSYNLEHNKQITGIDLKENVLRESIREAQNYGATVRLNCNVGKGYIDNREEILKFIDFSKKVGANSIRFAELKTNTDDFISLAEILNGEYGLNEDPFTLGCSKDTIIDGVNVNFRQMCGLQTPYRKAPVNPEQDNQKSVLYYDGVIYDSWQRANQAGKLNRLLQRLQRREIDVDDAMKQIKEITNGAA